MNSQKYQWLLFDADGTLFDFAAAATRALELSCRRVLGRYEPHFRELYEGINRQVWQDFERGRINEAELRTRRFALFCRALDSPADAASFNASYLGELAQNTALLPDAAAVVSSLATTHQLMIITNGFREVQRPRFAKSEICRHFADFIISGEVGVAKPDPRIFDAAFARMGHPARRDVLMIGDSLTSDIRGGNNYGIDTCWFNPQGAPRDRSLQITLEISRLSELTGLLRPDRD